MSEKLFASVSEFLLPDYCRILGTQLESICDLPFTNEVFIVGKKDETTKLHAVAKKIIRNLPHNFSSIDPIDDVTLVESLKEENVFLD